MRITAEKRLYKYWKKNPNARGALEAWVEHVRRAKWNSPQELAEDYGIDTVHPGNRAVFNIKGNHYRLVAHIHYKSHRLFIRFIGTHEEYNKIDVSTI